MTLVGEIPRINVKTPEKYEYLLQKYGAADFKNAVSRNLEKDYIERQAALLSVGQLSVIYQPINDLHTIIQSAAKGGVIAQFPIDGGVGDTGRDTANAPLVGKQVTLDRANVTYNIMHEAVMEGGNIAENDSITEGIEQLAGKMDHHLLTELKAVKLAANDVTAGATWATTGDPYGDINNAISKIITNSAVNPNEKQDNWMTVIAPIAAREGLQKINVVDGIKISSAELIRLRLGAQILYTRPPFNLDGATWPLTTEAIVIPTKDRHVGKFYTFDGGAMPSVFVTVNENGKRVSTNSWMKFSAAPSEKDGSLTENRRVSVISGVAA